METSIMETRPEEEQVTEQTEEHRNAREYGEFLFTIYPEPIEVKKPDDFWRDMPA